MHISKVMAKCKNQNQPYSKMRMAKILECVLVSLCMPTLLLGSLLIIQGSLTIYLTYESQHRLGDDPGRIFLWPLFYNMGLAVAAAGAALSATSLSGLLGFYKSRNDALSLCATLSAILFAMSGFSATSDWQVTPQFVHGLWYQGIVQSSDDSRIMAVLQYFQQTLKCCGYFNGYQDWGWSTDFACQFNSTGMTATDIEAAAPAQCNLPESCCTLGFKDRCRDLIQIRTDVRNYVWGRKCAEPLLAWVHDNLAKGQVVVAAFGAAFLVNSVAAFGLLFKRFCARINVHKEPRT